MDQSELTFLRIVEAGSLRTAAEQMNADPSAVSRRLSALEHRLGVKLLQRSTQRSFPTEAGTKYYEGLRRLADEKMSLEAQVAGEIDVPSGLLRVAAPVDFGALFVAPILNELQNQFPKLSVEMMLGSEFEEIAQQNIDVAVRIGRLPDSSLICRKLGEVQRVLVGGKDYIDKTGMPAHPVELNDHEFVFYTRRQSERPVTFYGPEGKVQVDMSGRFTVNSVTALHTLVESGRGLHVGPMWAFRDAIAAGRMIQLLPDYQLDAYALHAIYKSADFVPAKIRRFIDFLNAEIGRGRGGIIA